MFWYISHSHPKLEHVSLHSSARSIKEYELRKISDLIGFPSLSLLKLEFGSRRGVINDFAQFADTPISSSGPPPATSGL